METALREAGACGRFQVCHVIFTQLPRFVSVWGLMIMMFGNYDPGWRCKGGGQTMQTSGNYSIWNENDGGGGVVFGGGDSTPWSVSTTPRTAVRYGLDTEAETTHSKNNVYNETCDVIEMCDDVEFNPGSVTIVSEFQLVCDRKWLLRVILVVMSIGFLVGALAGGQVGEKFGRKVSLFSGCLIMGVFSGLAIFSSHWVMYMVCLFLIGVGGNFIQSASAIFTMEFLNSKWRSISGSIPTWNTSLCVFTLAAAMMKSWIHVHIVTCALSFIACVGYFIISESMRWLVVHGRYEEAEKVIQKVARINGKPSPTTETLLKLKGESDKNPEQKSTASSHPPSSTTYTYIHLLKERNLRVLTIKFSTIYFMIFVTYFALSFGINSLPGDFYTNAILSSVCEILIVAISGPLCNKIGRRWGGFAVSILGVFSCIGIVVALYASEGEAQSTIIKTCAFLARSGSMAKSTVGALFMVELFPTAVRSVAYGVLRAMAGVGGMFGPFLIPEPGRDSFAVCFSVMACCFLVSLAIFLSLPETNKLCLVDGIGGTHESRVTEDECV